ncbi:MAG: pyridoxal phosphate-dependent aminotransferase [Candidatus Bathyarchaeota archaeon]|nr:pyridoxal phosphate-dependent aminotransferase [Candidatus Bathyarchaeota archaeon]
MLSFLKEPQKETAIREAMASVTKREEANLPVIDLSSGNAGKMVLNEHLFTHFQLEVNESLPKPLRLISEALKRGLTKAFYSELAGLPYSTAGGTDAVKHLALKYFRKFHGVPLNEDDLDRVIVSAGGQQVLTASLRSIKSGTRIYIPRWEYSPVPEIIRSNGCKEVRIPLSDDLSLKLDYIKDKVEDESVLYLSMPNNPTGYTSPKDLSEITKIMGEKNGGLIWDAPYLFTILKLTSSKATFDREFQRGIINEFKNIFTEKNDNACILSSLSKTCLLTGLRFGIATSSEKWIKSMKTTISRENISSPTASFIIGAEALKLFLNEPITHEWLCRAVADRLTMLIEENIPLILPKNGIYGAFYGLIKTKDSDGSRFSNEIINKFGIVTIPGNSFYGDEIDVVRISLVATPWSEGDPIWRENVISLKKALS